MTQINKIIGQDLTVGIIKSALTKFNNKNGCIVGISGETGLGKTHILQYYFRELSGTTNYKCIFVENQAPIGSFKIGSIQPLNLFTRTVQLLFDKNYITAQKRLAMNMGMTALASIPLVGDIFYAVKEMAKDWRQYKREKSSEMTKKVSNAVADYFDSISSFTEKQPLILFFDDMHWADAQSLELLGLFLENISTMPLLIIFSYKKSIIDNQAPPLLSFLTKYDNSKNFLTAGLEPLNIDNIRTLSKLYINGYQPNSTFEQWLYEKTYGVPGIISEYLTFFAKNPPFNNDGSLIDNFENTNFFPESFNNIFSQAIVNLSDDEKNLLAVCSSEGREFTAYVITHLLNTDLITTIKRLKSLQVKTGIIKSTGARQRYGVMTTVYEFSQAYYHSYFENTLEYEESVSLHGSIASYLKQKYDQTTSQNIKNELAPYVAAHSSQSGDDETARKMLLVAAKDAEEKGSREMVQEAYEQYRILNPEGTDNSDISPEMLTFQNMLESQIMHIPGLNGSLEYNQGSDSNFPIDFNYVRRSVVDEYHNGKYDKAADLAITYLNTHLTTIKPSDQVQLLTLAAKSYIETANFESANRYCIQASEIIKNYKEPIPECLLLNTTALLMAAQGRMEESFDLLKQAAKKSVALPSEIRLLTLSNIALLMKRQADPKAEKYIMGIRKLAKQLNFEEFERDVIN